MKGKSKFNDRCPGAGPKKFCPSLFLCILKLTNKKQLPENQMNQPYTPVNAPYAMFTHV